MISRVRLALGVLLGVALSSSIAAFAAPPSASDPFRWLERVDGPRATAWVRAQNARTTAVLERDPRFARFYADALAVNSARDRIPAPQLVDGRIYNFWQDRTHVRGIWRTASVAEFARRDPHWTTVLDLDALARTERANWVWQSADCDSPSRTRCLIWLSDGGEDASTVREFDLVRRRFVPHGFTLARAKQGAVWVDDDTLLVSRAWRPGELTASGYPYVVKQLRRGQPLAQARTVARGSPADVGVDPFVLHGVRGPRWWGVVRRPSTFETVVQLAGPRGLAELALPRKANLEAVVAGRLVVSLQQNWDVGGSRLRAGSLVALDVVQALAHPAALHPTLVYAPGPREALDAVAAGGDRLVVQTLDNVRGRETVYTPLPNGAWGHRRLALPDDQTLDLRTIGDTGSTGYVSSMGFLTPTRLWQVDVATGSAAVVKALAPTFDASRDVVEQHEARSRDGTRVPYFLVHPRGLRADGGNPTILYGYGGFAVPITPWYSGTLGRLWLERGGTYAVANIRGGGEFGPAWHEAGLTTHRQRIYDDFVAVARDLIARRVTRPARLGIEGGSNGGLLVGVTMTQHPELFAAVDCAVPLLDMLRYEQIAAGSSWVGEYGSVAVPAQRAFLASISPYAQLRPGVRYPEAFIWTTSKDDRVGPQHARKFAAKLAALHQPYLFYEVVEGGHGSGANARERSLTSALEFTYFTRRLMRR